MYLMVKINVGAFYLCLSFIANACGGIILEIKVGWKRTPIIPAGDGFEIVYFFDSESSGVLTTKPLALPIIVRFKNKGTAMTQEVLSASRQYGQSKYRSLTLASSVANLYNSSRLTKQLSTADNEVN